MGRLNDVRFIKGNGGLARPAANEDPISGLIFNGMSLTFGSSGISGFDILDVDSQNANAALSYVRKFQYKEQLADCGISYKEYEGTTLTSVEKAMNTIHYHVSEFFRLNPNGTLYVMIKAGTGSVAVGDVTLLQNYAEGKIRQCGIFNSTLLTFNGTGGLQEGLTALENNHKPLSVVCAYSGKNVALSTLTGTSLATAGQRNISVLIGCDFSTKLANDLGDNAYYGCIGACIGAISNALVSECIGWVAKFPLSLTNPALFNGLLVRDVSIADQELLNDNRYIFVRTFVGDSNCYFNDSHTCDLETSDYAYIESERTIDKATREIRKQLLPYVNAPLKVDAASGKLDSTMVAYYESIANHALEDMTKAGEISGGSVSIDANQNVLSTSTLNVIVKIVPVGVMRQIVVNIGFALSL